MLPPLTNDEFKRLLIVLRPPQCAVSSAIITAQKRSLTGCQLACILIAIHECELYNTHPDRNRVMEEFEKATSEHGWGWRGRTFKK